MKKVVLDTNILIDYVNGYVPWVNDTLTSRKPKLRLVIPTIVIGEYWTSDAFDDEKLVKIAENTFSLFEKQDLTEEIAKVLGGILRYKSYQQGASLADLIVAATSIYMKAELATGNKSHFVKIPDLKFFNPNKISENL